MRIEGGGQGVYMGGGAQDPQVKAYDKQIEMTKKKIREVKGNGKMPEDAKAEQLKALEQQLAQLQAQKRARQAEVAREQQEKMAEAMQEQTQAEETQRAKQTQKEEQAPQMDASTQTAFIKADSYQASTRALGSLRAQFEAELFQAENGSYLTPPDPEAAAGIREKLSKLYEITGQQARAADESFEDAAAATEEKAEEADASKQGSLGLLEDEERREQEQEEAAKPGQLVDETV